MADQDPAPRPVAQHTQPPQSSMDGSQLVQWLSIQASNMAGDLQHNVRALMVRASACLGRTPGSQGATDYATEPGSGD